jgi:SNF2 family DNA or RNA helicase
MAKLEDLSRGAKVKGILPEQTVTVLDVQWHGSSVIELTYKETTGKTGNELIYRDREPELEVVTNGTPWSFDGDGEMFRLVSEARRIRLAYLFDPMLAVHTSLVEPLPHQITAVYGEMLSRQPLRYLLADDPGAGKTIMTGLFLKELLIRGDLTRCLICCPGSLSEQWQDELFRRFQLNFDILTREMLETSRSGNAFQEKNLLICRMDQLSRNEDILLKLEASDWDVIVCDEAHKMSASFFAGEVKATKRYRLGQLLAKITRHFLLLTATPHNGKEEDFQLFMALLDGDRFEGKFRDGVHTADVTDLMRRMVKEQLLKFDGTPLFPERRAYTANYKLSEREAQLYNQVTEYVREEMNRVERMASEGEDKRTYTVGFALTTLQRRLASSPEAIYQSLYRRRTRLEKLLREEKLARRGGSDILDSTKDIQIPADDESLDEYYDEAPSEEIEEKEEEVVDSASAARTIRELEAEIRTLIRLEDLAAQVRRSGRDRKWEELSSLLQGDAKVKSSSEIFGADGHRRKLIIFTEHRDTLNYLVEKIRTLLGRPEAVVTIHGSILREERRRIQEEFTQNKDVLVLVATDAAGEGINLQRANLMVNYDLPWNPNRIEQRFGRIHRIGQREVCHLWNMVASETREGDVYARLLEKLEQQRESLGGGVFDILGKCFTDKPLRELLMEAIRYGDQPEVKARLEQAIDNTMDQEHLKLLIEERALTHETLDAVKVKSIREEMERAEARRMQPHYIATFFKKAFHLLGGSFYEREQGRYEITHVPSNIRSRDRMIGTGEPVLVKYERITFEKDLIYQDGNPMAEFICPGHPLLEACNDLIQERYRELLKKGTVLIDSESASDEIRVLFYLEHAIQDARTDKSGQRRIISREMEFVEINSKGEITQTGYAPYLDYRPIKEEEKEKISRLIEQEWLKENLESNAVSYAVENLVPGHLKRVKEHKEEYIRKTAAAVKDRLTKEINYWDFRANELKEQELAGKINARINSVKARNRADELESRMRKRIEELEQERHITPLPPNVIGGAIIIPEKLLLELSESSSAKWVFSQADRERIDRLAVAAVVAKEKELGRIPVVMPANNPGYDIESTDPETGILYFIEVKGKAEGASTVTVSKTQILTALNKPDEFILAIVEVNSDSTQPPHYIVKPFRKEPDFAVTSVNFSLSELLNSQGKN